MPSFKEFTDIREGINIVYKGKSLFSEVDPLLGFKVDVISNELFGNLLFIDGELQISQSDIKKYHISMLDLVPNSTNVLVIGDGDGGFTNEGVVLGKNVAYVEPSDTVRRASAMYLNSDWSVPIELHSKTIETFIQDGFSSFKPDAIMFCLTDKANSNLSFESIVKSLMSKYNVPIVFQVGCTLDSNYDTIVNRYQVCMRNLGLGYMLHDVFIPSYLSNQTFMLVNP